MRSLAIALFAMVCTLTAAQGEITDDVDEIVSWAITSAMRDQPAVIDLAIHQLEDIDEELVANGEEPTGLVAHLRTLRNATENRGSVAFSEQEAEIAGEALTSEDRRMLNAMAAAQPWPTMHRLRWENRYNRVAGGVNWFMRRMMQIFTGQTQALLQMVNDIVFSYRPFLYPTTRERKVRALAEELAITDAGTDEARTASEWAEDITVKVERERHRDFRRRVRLALEQQRWELAEDLALSALELWPGDRAFEKGLREADHHLGELQRGWRRSLLVDPAGEIPLTENDWNVLGDALRDWMMGQSVFATQVGGSRTVAERVDLLQVVGLMRRGNRAAACGVLEDLASEGGVFAPLAEQWLSAAPFHPEVGIEQAMQRRHRLTRRHILQGARGTEENLYLASSSAISEGLAAPMALGFLFFIDSSIRGIALAIQNPIGAEAVVDELVALDRQEGLTEEQNVLLREMYRELGELDRALEAQERLDNPDPALTRRLRGRLARQILTMGEDTDDLAQRRLILSHVMSEYPETDAAREAWRLLQADPFEGQHLTLDEVRRNGARLMELGLPLPPTLWDGVRANGEISEDGVWVETNGLVHHRLDGDRIWIATQPTVSDPSRLLAAVEDITERNAADVLILGRRQPRVPLEITGSLGASGAYAVPQLQRYRHIDDDLPLYEH